MKYYLSVALKVVQFDDVLYVLGYLRDYCCFLQVVKIIHDFMLDQTTLLPAMYFSEYFDGFIVTISMERSTRFHLDVSASLGIL